MSFCVVVTYLIRSGLQSEINILKIRFLNETLAIYPNQPVKLRVSD